jgi:predicted HicB family RNase H-like nuclease
MEYRGYRARIEYSEDDQAFVGRVLGINDQIAFHGSSVSELKKHFKSVVDNYIAHCEARGQEPEREYSGKFNLRLDPTLHKQLSREAKRKGLSLNELVARKLQGREAA